MHTSTLARSIRTAIECWRASKRWYRIGIHGAPYNEPIEEMTVYTTVQYLEYRTKFP